MAAVVALFCLCSICRAEAYKAADREPTPEETYLLELINRFRADPVAEAGRVAPGGDAIKGYMGRGVDWEMFKTEMKALKPSPPVVMNLDLLDASRKHSHYMILNDLTHVEDPAKPGFVAADMMERIKLAGYKNLQLIGENCFRDSSNPLHSHSAFIVDFGDGGAGGMQLKRGHRMNMINPAFREVGPSALPHKNLSVTHEFGSRKAGRLAGGVVYFDKNNNQFYDVGEGVSGVRISSSDGSNVSAWKSGGFTLELTSDQAATLTAEFQGQKFSQSFPAGKDNIKFDWIVPEKVALERAEKLLAEVDKIKDVKSPAFFASSVALYVGTRGLGLNAETMKRINELTGALGPELESHQKAVLDAYAVLDQSNSASWSKIVSEHRKPYRNTIADAFFKDAETAATIKQSVQRFEKVAESTKVPAQERRALATQIESTEKQMTTPTFKSEIAAMTAKVKAGTAVTK